MLELSALVRCNNRLHYIGKPDAPELEALGEDAALRRLEQQGWTVVERTEMYSEEKPSPFVCYILRRQSEGAQQ